MENPQAHPPMTPDRAKASLGLSTLLQSFLLPKAQQGQQPQNGQEQGGNEPQEGKTEPAKDKKPQENVEEVKASMELEMNKKLDEIRKEMKEDSQRELDQIKELVTSALAEEDTNEPDKTSENS